jgi:hypothetical protein
MGNQVEVSYLHDLYNQPEKHPINQIKGGDLYNTIIKNMMIATKKKQAI